MLDCSFKDIIKTWKSYLSGRHLDGSVLLSSVQQTQLWSFAAPDPAPDPPADNLLDFKQSYSLKAGYHHAGWKLGTLVARQDFQVLASVDFRLVHLLLSWAELSFCSAVMMTADDTPVPPLPPPLSLQQKRGTSECRLYSRVEWFSTFIGRLGIFLEVQFQKIGNFGRARAAKISFHFKKAQRRSKLIILWKFAETFLLH